MCIHTCMHTITESTAWDIEEGSNIYVDGGNGKMVDGGNGKMELRRVEEISINYGQV